MLKSRPRQRGMTVVEVIIAVAIVGILLALAAPSMNTWIQNVQLRNAAESILGGIKRARFEAVSRNTTVAFELQDPNSTQWHVCLYDVVAQACKAASPDLAAKGASEGSPNARVGTQSVFTNFNAVLDPGTDVPSLVAFDPFGRVSPSSPTNIARIDVRNPTLASADERRMEIFIGAGGEVRMCDPQLSLATNPQGCE
jgi:type IV fimbrial biogenesis protein FimT